MFFLVRTGAACLCLFAWAVSLWKRRRHLALLLSVCCLALTYLPSIPPNSEAFRHEFVTTDKDSDTREIDAVEENKSLSSVEPGGEVVEAPPVEVSAPVIDMGFGDLGLLALVYTWLRWGRRRGPTYLESEEAASPPSVYRKRPGLYTVSEICLVTGLPLVMLFAFGLTYLQQRAPRITLNMAWLFETCLILLPMTALMFFYLQGEIPAAEPLKKTRSGLSVAVLFLAILAVAACTRFLWRLAGDGALDTIGANPALPWKVAYRLVPLAGCLLWFWGLRKDAGMLAMCGGLLFVSFFEPYSLMRPPLSHTESRSASMAATPPGNSQEAAEAGALTSKEEDARPQDTQHHPAAMDFPLGTDPARNIFFRGYISFHAAALLLVTLMHVGRRNLNGFSAGAPPALQERDSQLAV